MLKRIIIVLSLIIVTMVGFFLYYAFTFNQSFWEYNFQQRKNKCDYFNDSTKSVLFTKYEIRQQDIIQINKPSYSFEALVLEGKNSKDYLVLIHGKRECPLAMIRGGFQLYNMGYSVIIPILYAHGNDSLNGYIDYGHTSIKQVNECIDIASKRNAKNIGLIGRSMGASIAIIAAAKNKKVDAIVAECPLKSVESSIAYKHKLYSRLPNFPFLNIKLLASKQILKTNIDSLSCIHFVDQISPRPMFIMAAKKDMVVNPQDFYDIYEKAKEPKLIWEEDINHTKFHSQLKNEFYIRVSDFFKQSFKN